MSNNNISSFLERITEYLPQNKTIVFGELNQIAMNLLTNDNYHIVTTDFSVHKKNIDTIFWDDLSNMKEKYESIILFYTKSKNENIYLLSRVLDSLHEHVDIYLIGEKDSGINSSPKLFSKYNVTLKKQDSARHCSLFIGTIDKRNFIDIDLQSEYILDVNLKIKAAPGIFSSEKLDIGTKFLLDNMKPILKGSILDLCCGCGVIGSYLKFKNKDISLTLADCNYWACKSAKDNLIDNQLDGTVIVSDMYSEIKDTYDYIITNPPFHAGFETHYDATYRLLTESASHLKVGGELIIVANKFLPYEPILKKHFESVQILNENNQFKIISAKR